MSTWTLSKNDRNHNLTGKRVELVHTSDPYTNLKSGDQGTIEFVDDMGTIFVDWDVGGGIGLVPGEDRYKIL